ncbi:MAG: hypothetical protein MI976_14060 [Pseudomonadales bacterium]|nr:hypothetical protein [Pseudomonadales bacterium]
MDATTKQHYLKQYLKLFGWLNVLVVSFPVPLLVGDFLLWQPRNLAVELMLSSLYFAMGIVMVASSRAPQAPKAFIDFLVLVNLLHGLLMFAVAENWRHVFLDALPITLMGALPLFIYPWGLQHLFRYSSRTSL